jgi:hypothetical protein
LRDKYKSFFVYLQLKKITLKIFILVSQETSILIQWFEKIL